MSEIVLHVEEQAPITLNYVEAKAKPETVGHATPDYTRQTIEPESGSVFSSVVVEPIPDPTEVVQITTNGTHDVRRAGSAEVNVPTGVFPAGTKSITANGTGIDVTDYAAVDVAVPVPTMPDEYPIGGSLLNKTLTGYHFSPNLSITTITNDIFNGCNLLETIENFPSTVTSIGNQVFNGCSKLKNLTLPTGLLSVGQFCFGSCGIEWTSLPNTLQSIGANAFQGCAQLQLESLPNSITSLNNNAFSNCYNLRLTSLPNSITVIPNFCFYVCTNLPLRELPSHVTYIGRDAFRNSGVQITHIPSTVTDIGANAFSSCTGLTSITFDGTPTSIDNTVFTGSTNLTQINCPWSEGAVANAPWGATNATITYDYVGG